MQSFGATLVGPLVTVLVQLVNVPVMLRLWGAERYGEWLVLTAIPTYLLLSDLGFGNVAASDMTMRVHAGDREGAIETFESTLALVLMLTAVICAALFMLALLVPTEGLLHLHAIAHVQARATLLLLSLNCLVILQWSVIMAAYRCAGRFAQGMLYVNVIRIVEGASALALLVVHAGPVGLAALMLSISTLGTVWLVIDHRRHVGWLRFSVRNASRARIRVLLRPALACMAFPACAALTTQGMTLAVGATLGPLAVACFNPMRTLARTALQLSDAVRTAVWPELSSAYGRQDWPLARKLHRSSVQVAIVLAGISVATLALAGPHVFRLWTSGRVVFDRSTFFVLLLAVVANCAWNASSAVPLSANRNERIAPIYLALSVLSLVLACVLLPRLGLRAAALAMLLADAGMTVAVVPISSSLTFDCLVDFLRSVFDLRLLKSFASRI